MEVNMERKMKREDQALTKEKCEKILKRNTSGVLAINGDDGYPYAVPLTYAYHNGKLIFHGRKAGYKFDCINKDGKASFCIIDVDKVVPADYTTYYRSVVARGVIKVVDAQETIRDVMTKLGQKFRPGHNKECQELIDKEWDNFCVYVMDIEEITGKEAIELVRAKF